ncbi:hypothetical protein [Catellatospora sp. NPDC049133]|uniref:hypothetical protein n=1 Tax=Catellatospora sp. NPDC049133 TaxID=3155499 RepID=UPI0033F55994
MGRAGARQLVAPGLGGTDPAAPVYTARFDTARLARVCANALRDVGYEVDLVRDMDLREWRMQVSPAAGALTSPAQVAEILRAFGGHHVTESSFAPPPDGEAAPVGVETPETAGQRAAIGDPSAAQVADGSEPVDRAPAAAAEASAEPQQSPPRQWVADTDPGGTRADFTRVAHFDSLAALERCVGALREAQYLTFSQVNRHGSWAITTVRRSPRVDLDVFPAEIESLILANGGRFDTDVAAEAGVTAADLEHTEPSGAAVDQPGSADQPAPTATVHAAQVADAVQPEQDAVTDGLFPISADHSASVREPLRDLPYTHFAFFDDLEAAEQCADRLRDIGCRVSLRYDDSSWALTAVRREPLDGQGRPEEIEQLIVAAGGDYETRNTSFDTREDWDRFLALYSQSRSSVVEPDDALDDDHGTTAAAGSADMESVGTLGPDPQPAAQGASEVTGGTVDLAPDTHTQLDFQGPTERGQPTQDGLSTDMPGDAATPGSSRRGQRRGAAAAAATMTMRTAFAQDALLVMARANRNPATDPGLRAQLIAVTNASGFTWAFADDEGIHHQVRGDALHPQMERSGLITWQQLWDRIGPGITQQRTAELEAAFRDGVEFRARSGPHLDQRLHDAESAFYRPAPEPMPPQPPDLDRLVEDIVFGRISRAEAFAALLASDAAADAVDPDAVDLTVIGTWQSHVEHRIEARRRELLGDQRIQGYEVRVGQLREAGLGSSDAEVRAFQDVWNGLTNGRVGGLVPERSPYKAGDRIQLHGYPALNGLQRTGFVGTVHGYLGSTLLTGLTDSGEMWAESWGVLVREGEPNDSVVKCTCCDLAQQTLPASSLDEPAEVRTPAAADEAAVDADSQPELLRQYEPVDTQAEVQAAAAARRANPKRFASKTSSANPFHLVREINPSELRQIRAMLQPTVDDPSRVKAWITPSHLVVYGAVLDTVTLSELMGAAYVEVGRGESIHGPQVNYGPADRRGFVPEAEPADPQVPDLFDGLLLDGQHQPAAGRDDIRPSRTSGDATDQAAAPRLDHVAVVSHASVDRAADPAGESTPAPEPVTFQPGSQAELAPSTPLQRARANIAALKVLAEVTASGVPASPEQQRLLARWGGWGSVPQVFDEDKADWAWARDELRQLLTPEEYAAAARTTVNAHYTDAAFVREIWQAVQDLGFAGGQVLEPGSGAGVFIGMAPDSAQMTGVELDPTTARIAQLLYPQAKVLNESFAATRAPANTFDLAVGNVPFANVVLHDPRHNPHGFSIHNHFIVKSLDLVKPGGLVAVLTSAYTMDAVNPAVRRVLAQSADLVGAVRLPSRAHRTAAGTDAVTDLLVLRKREPDRVPDSVEWELTSPITIGEHEKRINDYFIAHPHRVLGELTTGRGLYRDDDLTVRGPVGDELATALRETLAAIVAEATDRGLTFNPQTVTTEPVVLVGRAEGRPEGYIQTVGDRFSVVHDGAVVPHDVPASQAAELRALLGLRDTTMALLDAESASVDDTDEINQLRADLGRRYDTYVAKWGPINRFSLRKTGRVDPETGQAKQARIRPPQGRFREDTYAAAVYALEHFDAETQTAAKVDLFTRRVVAPRPVAQGAETAADALAIVMDVHGRVDLDHVASLLGVSSEEARDQLGELVYADPAASGELTPAAAYLSGNVRAKLLLAQHAAENDPTYDVNVRALEAVIPEDLQPVDIHAALGTVWIKADYVQQFLQETLQDESITVRHLGGSNWIVEGGDRGGVQSREVWGTPRMAAVKLAAALLEQRLPSVFDVIEVGGEERRVFNAEATAAARDKAKELDERFGEWVWEDPERAGDLVRVYNDLLNNLVLRTYDNPALALPGLATSFTLRAHQLAAVARIIAEPAVLLAHEVGAGKTLEMVVGAMELRRLGLARKPAVVIPNHMVEQFGREWLQAYPQAKILMVTRDDLAGEKRRQFVARCATGDWDAVILTRSAFERIPMSAAEQDKYMRQELEALERQLDNARAAEEGEKPSRTVKRMEKMKIQLEERLKKKMDSVKDQGITFEQTGLDYVMVDEIHGYVNLATASNIPGAAIAGSARATDLDMKLTYLRAKHGDRRGRVVTGATATPFPNSITQAYVIQKLLQPDVLRAAGITDFDTWKATFGEVVTSIELSPDGSGFRQNSRFAKFKNVPELLRMFWTAADVKTAEDLNLPTPLLAQRASDGARLAETVSVPPISEQLDFIAWLGERAEKVRTRQVKPEEDNMLKISSDGRKAALDMRMVNPGYRPSGPQKVDIMAERIFAIWEQTRDNQYEKPGGGLHPRLGSLQIVFLDQGTPSSTGFNAYEELRRLLAAKGMPRDMVRFVHEAANDKAKGELFAACRDGRVAVVIGSSEKMGVGTNIQARAVALHHGDCPWKPAEVQQREGRIMRQGNQNPEIQILRYVTERTFDGYMWQTVARKQKFISQVMRGRLDVREIEDIGEAQLSYNEVMAIAAGNPLLLDKARAEAEVQRLSRSERAHHNGQASLDRRIAEAERGITRAEQMIAQIDQAMHIRQETKGDAFTMQVAASHYDQRAEAGRALQAAIAVMPLSQRSVELGAVGGFAVTGFVWRSLQGNAVTLELAGIPDVAATGDGGQIVPASVHMPLHELQAAGAVGLVQRLENKLTALERDREKLTAKIERHRREIEQAQAQLGKGFQYATELATARAQLAGIEERMAQQAAPPAPEQPLTPEQLRERIEAAVAAADGGIDTTPAPAASATTALADGQPAAEQVRPWMTRPPAEAQETPASDAAAQPPQPDVHDAARSADDSTAAAGSDAMSEPGGADSVESRAEQTPQIDPAVAYGLQTLRSTHASDRSKLASYMQMVSRIRELSDVDQQALRTDIERIAATGPRQESSAAQYLLERIDPPGEISEAQARAISAAGIFYLNDPAERVRRYAGLTTQTYAALHERHQRSIQEDLAEIAASNAPARARRGRYNTRTSGGVAGFVRDAAHLARTLTTPPDPASASTTESVSDAEIRLEINGRSVLVYGITREDAQLRQLARAASFKWLPSLRAWGLPRTMLPESRRRSIDKFVASMAGVDRALTVNDATSSQGSGSEADEATTIVPEAEAPDAGTSAASAQEPTAPAAGLATDVAEDGAIDSAVVPEQQLDPWNLAERAARVRQRQLLLALETIGSGYQRITGDGVRYAAEVADATPQEWNWMAQYARDNPQVLQRDSSSDRGWPTQEQTQRSTELVREAGLAFREGRTADSLDLLDDAQVLDPKGSRDWARMRQRVTDNAQAQPTTATPPAPTAAPAPGSVVAAAFPRPIASSLAAVPHQRTEPRAACTPQQAADRAEAQR